MSSNLTLNQSGFANLTIRGSSTVLMLRSGAIVPVATANTAGSVIVGANLTVDGNGVLSVILPANYTLPVANATQLGGVKVGANLAIDGNGVLSANTPNVSGYVPILPNTTWTGNSTFSGSTLQATANGVLTQIASGLTSGTPSSVYLQYQTALDASGTPGRIVKVTAGGLSACLSSTNYTNGTACATSSVQSSVSAVNLSFNDGTGNSTRLQLLGTSITFTQLTGNTTYSANSLLTQSYADGRYYPLTGNPSGFLTALPVATNATLGGVITGANITNNNGTISVNLPSAYTLPNATTTTLGGIIVGSNLTIANGVLSANSSGNGDVTQAGNNTFSGVNTFNNGVTVNATLSLNSNVISRPKIAGYTESASVPTISGGNLTLDLASGNVFGPVALNAAVTNMTISNVPASGTAASFTLLLKANGTALSFTWPTSILWPSAATPNITSTANKVDAFTFVTVDGGTSYIGFKAGQNY